MYNPNKEAHDASHLRKRLDSEANRRASSVVLLAHGQSGVESKRLIVVDANQKEQHPSSIAIVLDVL